jgi:uncharacterized sulfatase
MRLQLRLALAIACLWLNAAAGFAARPNVLIAISDDQSYPHASAYGYGAIQTPAFDRVAKAGVLFRNAFSPSPGCSPMRAAFLTGREIWQLREAGTHASLFPRDLPVFTEQLQQAGYHVGMTGKGWGPGKAVGWPHNPAGKSYGARSMTSPAGISTNDYAANFAEFLQQRGADQPFCFWYGGTEPHRGYEPGIGSRHGIDPARLELPPFLPDSDVVRRDMADYLYEIQWFDSHLQRMLDTLDRAGELDNTLVIVTSDNGMSFPRAKANLYEYGIHMPLAISWPARIPAGQVSDELVSLIDVTRTIFEAAQVSPQQADQLRGHSLLAAGVDASRPASPPREAVYSGRERHSCSRYHCLGYPSRCIRTKTHLYIRNFTPQRWPAGDPQTYDQASFDADGKLLSSRLGDEHGGYHDIDASPTLSWMIEHRQRADVAALFAAAVELRPGEELYDIRQDPGCLNNLAAAEEAKAIKDDLASRLTRYLSETGDLRQLDPSAAHVWETYPRVSSLRWFPAPAWAIEHPALLPRQDWLEQRRPRGVPDGSR